MIKRLFKVWQFKFGEVLKMMIYPDRHYTTTIKSTLSNADKSNVNSEESKIKTRIKGHNSVHTLLIDAKEAYERWNAAKCAIDNPNLANTKIHGLPPKIQLVAACSNYFWAIDEINKRDKQASRLSFWINIISVAIGILGFIVAILTYFGVILIPSAK